MGSRGEGNRGQREEEGKVGWIFFVFGGECGLSGLARQCQKGYNGEHCKIGNDFQIIMEGQIAKIIIPMLKNQAVNPHSHQFILSKIRSSPSQSLLSLSFEPQNRPNSLFESIVPHFNRDQRHFTPAFVLSRDEKFYRENINFERMRFEERIQNAQEKQIVQGNYKFVPPSHYCQLCKTNFEEYIHHTQSQQHCHLIAASPANLYIEELAGKFLPLVKRGRKIVKKGRKERGMDEGKKNSCKLSDSNKGNIARGKNVSAIDSKNSNQSTNLGSGLE